MEAFSVSLLIFTIYALTIFAYCIIKKNEINTVRVIYINSIVLYIILLASLSFLPVNLNQEKGFNYIPLAKFLLSDAAKLASYINISIYSVILFLPLGFMTGMQCKLIASKSTVLYALMLGLLVSLIIEVVQLYLPFNRICDVDEILFNTIGSFLGAVLFYIMSKKRFMINIFRKILYY